MNDDELTEDRRARRAVVYLRQSTERQVQRNRESRELQYALVDRARALGWQRVEVFDDDLGSSAGFAASRRAGFERLLAAVALGDVGLVLCREASRLSRTDKDWCRLLEICQVFDTLIADAERVYDLTSLDDQLVLGIKGTLSVVELKVLRQRMLAGARNKARRGEYYTCIAAGYIRDGEGGLMKDPNQRVRDAITLIFDKFGELASARQTYLWLRRERVEVPVTKRRDGKVELVFQLPTQSFILNVLNNPVYAGAYVWGRRRQKVVLQDGVPTKRPGKLLEPEQAAVFIRDHHEGYIDWPTFEANRQTMRNNSRRWDRDEKLGPVRRGAALLAGLLRCGHCGRKLHVRYWGAAGTAPRYLCIGDFQSGGSYCLGFGGLRVDGRVSEAALEVVSPLGIEASLRAIDELQDPHREKRALLEHQIEQSRYEAARAFEQYDEVDARNRLVAAELERRWNVKLSAVEQLERELDALEQHRDPLDEHERRRLLELGEHFADVWNSEACPVEIKKRILRTVLREVVATEPAKGTLKFVLHWQGGTHTSFEMPRPTKSGVFRTAQADLDIIRKMAVRYGDAQIARVLVRLGRRTGRGHPWTAKSVHTARRKYGIKGHRRRPAPDPNVLSLHAAARYADVSTGSIRRLVNSGLLAHRQLAPYAPWEIERADLEAEPVASVLRRLRETGKITIPEGVCPEQTYLFLEDPGT